MNGEDVSLFQGFATRSWLEWELGENGERDASVMAAHWVFMGSFQRRLFRASLGKLPRTSVREEFPIRDLPFFPLRFAEADVAQVLRNRGAMSWECRRQKYVSYIATQSDAMQPLVSCAVLLL